VAALLTIAIVVVLVAWPVLALVELARAWMEWRKRRGVPHV
jgi:hypothetical protein